MPSTMPGIIQGSQARMSISRRPRHVVRVVM